MSVQGLVRIALADWLLLSRPEGVNCHGVIALAFLLIEVMVSWRAKVCQWLGIAVIGGDEGRGERSGSGISKSSIDIICVFIAVSDRSRGVDYK